MKKKILALLLAVVMIFSLLPVTAFAEPAEDPFEGYIEWGDDPEEEGCMPTAPGNYKLVADITIEDCWAVPKGVEETATVTNLCLNGHVLCVNAYPGIAVEQYSELNIYDTKDSNATHYLKFNEDDDRYQYVNDDPAPEGAVPVTGGLITTSRDRLGIGVGDYGRVNMYGGTIAGFARTVELNGTDCDFNMHDGKICYNYGDNESYGSAVEVLAGRFTMVGGELSHNYANCGGAVGVDDKPNASFVMTGGKITDNYAACEGGGVYFYTCDSCVAEGTLVTMADGTQKLVEELQTGDMLRIFDHKTGELGVAPLLYFLDHNEKRDGSYTLHFASGKEITAVGRHCFFEKKANNYIMLNPKTAASYIGCEFYNADEGKWETLKSVTILDEPIYCYSLMTALGNNANAVTDGLLSSELRGIFDYDEELKIDEERLAADIEKFGLMRFEDQDYFPKEVFDLLDGQYLNLIIGRGVLREDEVYSLLDAYASCFISGEEETPVNAPMLLASSAPRLTASHPSFGVDGPDGGCYLGGTAVIDDNYAYGLNLDEETGEPEGDPFESNIFLGTEKLIEFGEGTGEGKNGIAVPENGMRVGVNKNKLSEGELDIICPEEYTSEDFPVQITTNYSVGYDKYLFSDSPNYYVNHVASTTDYLELKAPEEGNYAINVIPSENGTVTVSQKEATKDVEITLTVKPANGYKLDNLNVKTASDTDVTVKGSGDTYSFPMSDKGVFVSAEFVEADEGGSSLLRLLRAALVTKLTVCSLVCGVTSFARLSARIATAENAYIGAAARVMWTATHMAWIANVWHMWHMWP